MEEACIGLFLNKIQACYIDTCLNQCRLKIGVKKVQTEQELFDEEPYVNDYFLFVLNLEIPPILTS